MWCRDSVDRRTGKGPRCAKWVNLGCQILSEDPILKKKNKNQTEKKLAQEALSKKDYNNRLEHLYGNSLRAGLS